mgnify:FL=1
MSYDRQRLFEDSDPMDFAEVQHGEFSVRVSAPERAILETIHDATTNAAVDSALELMRGLTTLRPRVLQWLLEGCRSIKVKRFFLWAAEASGHEWFNRLEAARVDLGKGKRLFYRGGRFDRKYRITVPRDEAHA